MGNFQVVFPSKFYVHSSSLPSSPRANTSEAFQILINLHSQLSLPIIDIYRLLLTRPVYAVMHFSPPALSAGRAYLLRTCCAYDSFTGHVKRFNWGLNTSDIDEVTVTILLCAE